MSHQIVLKVDKFTKVVLVLIVIFLAVLIFKPLFENKKVMAQYPDEITVYLRNGDKWGRFPFPIEISGKITTYR